MTINFQSIKNKVNLIGGEYGITSYWLEGFTIPHVPVGLRYFGLNQLIGGSLHGGHRFTTVRTDYLVRYFP